MCMPNVHLKKYEKTSQIFTSWVRSAHCQAHWDRAADLQAIPRTDLEDYPKWMHMFPQRVFSMVMVFDVCLI